MKKKDELLHQIADLFSKADYEKISLRDISKSLNMTKSGLYYHFASKQDMLFKIISGYQEKVLADLNEKLESFREPEEKLAYLVRCHIQFFVDYPAETKVVILERHSVEAKYQEVIKEKEMEYFNNVKKVLKDLQKKFGFEIDLNVAAFSLMGSLNWVCMWYKPEGKVSPEVLIDTISNLFIRGIGGSHK